MEVHGLRLTTYGKKESVVVHNPSETTQMPHVRWSCSFIYSPYVNECKSRELILFLRNWGRRLTPQKCSRQPTRCHFFSLLTHIKPKPKPITELLVEKFPLAGFFSGCRCQMHAGNFGRHWALILWRLTTDWDSDFGSRLSHKQQKV